MTETIDILDRLVAFPTVSRTPNTELIDYVRGLLEGTGAEISLVGEPDGSRVNLYATIGPRDRAGVLLSGHTDVVPVEGQAWTRPPFELTRGEGRLYGRGTTDMKGFCAAALAAARRAGPLQTPLHLALSYDEEIGCVGVRSLIDQMGQAPHRPAMCIVGEPTGMAVATGHKGKRALRAICTGREGHSALAPLAMNALHLAADFITALREEQAHLAALGPRDDAYDVAYSTVHAGIVRGGVQVNIVPNRAEVDWEIRHLAGDDPAAILARIRRRAAEIVLAAGDEAAGIEIVETGGYPGLDTAEASAVVDLAASLTGQNGTMKVAFGTEGGLFDQWLEIPTVVCGPGFMAQGHTPDEFVAEEQLAACDAMLDRLLGRLEHGL
ncbi:MAG: acetylornithine deacetylase [Pseudomonadota bacterium]